jgi:hypothetical protein
MTGSNGNVPPTGESRRVDLGSTGRYLWVESLDVMDGCTQ